ncbi:MAG: hypothetical protein V4611_02430 [Patescibacteria group bacterium]
MTYISGTLTSANPAADLYALMDTALTSAGYTLFDTVIIGARTHKMWRSAAGNNSQNLTWYLDVTYTTTGNGSIWLSTFEDFNATTDLGYRGPYLAFDSTIESTYYSRFGATGYALETNWATVANTTNNLVLSTANFGYWISITADRVIGLTSISTTKVVYAGFFEPNSEHIARADTALFPLITGTVTQDAAMGSAMLTRAPKGVSASIYWQYTARTYSYSAITTSAEGGYGVIGDNSVNPYTGYNTARGRNVYVVFGYYANGLTATNANSTTSATVGKLRDVYYFAAASSVARGDTITIAGQIWILCTSTSNFTFAFKAI